MSKAHITDLLSEYIEGSLTFAGAEKVKAHLAFCNSCRQALTETEHHIDVLRTTPPARVPAGLEAKVLARVHEALEQPAVPVRRASASGPSSSWFTPFRAFALAATCGVVFMVVKNMPRNLGEKAPAPQVEDRGKNEVGQNALVAEPARQDAPAEEEKKTDALSGASKDLDAAGTSVRAAVGETSVAVSPAPAQPAAAVVVPPAAFAQGDVKTRDAANTLSDKSVSAKKAVDDSGRLEPQAAPWAAKEKTALMQKASSNAATGPAVNGQPMPAARRAMAAEAASSAAPSGIAPSALAGNRSAIETPLETVVSSQADWEDLWKRHNAGVQPQPALPTVDFQTQDVLAIFGGPQPTGGYRVVILDVYQTHWNGDPARVVPYRIAGPRAGTMAAQVISYPYVFSIQPRFTGQTYFQKRP